MKRRKETLTQARLKEILHYDPKTGIFKWKIGRQGTKGRGSITGCLNTYGYLITRIDGKIYRNNRLAWLYVHGYFPEQGIDHINRIKIDNRICNLREASPQCNSRNCKKHVTNTSGVKGVYWDKSNNKWLAYLKINYKNKYLGLYKSFDNAVCARLAGEQCVEWSGCDSNSSAYQYVQEMLKRTKKRKLPKIIV